MATPGFHLQEIEPDPTTLLGLRQGATGLLAGDPALQVHAEGPAITLYTYHKPLTHALAKAMEQWTARRSRHLSYLAEFTSTRHISGVDNVVADTLSRPPAGEINAVTATPVQVDYEAIPEAQRACPETAAAGIASTTLQQVQFGGTQLLCDTSGPHPRPLIPAAHRR